jgi:hypothetical protein
MLIANILSPVSEMKKEPKVKKEKEKEEEEEKGQEIKGVVDFQQSAKCHTHSVGSRRLYFSFSFSKRMKMPPRFLFTFILKNFFFGKKMCPIALSK